MGSSKLVDDYAVPNASCKGNVSVKVQKTVSSMYFLRQPTRLLDFGNDRGASNDTRFKESKITQQLVTIIM